MPATSPYQGNDYQAVSNFRPYELPINDIFKGITAQNQFWDAGAAKVKSVYADALGLDLTLDANNEVKKNYLKDAEKQLNKLSTMDLSDPSVQRQGFNLFKPLFKDEAIMYDNELTKKKKSIYSDALAYKTRKLSTTGKEGEGYSDRNLAFSLDGFEEFTSDLTRDPAKLKEIYGKLAHKEYTPYYDPTQEYKDILNICKGSGGTTQDVADGGGLSYLYFDATSKSGANSSETSNCFMKGLSDKAKNQMSIDGWAYYKGSATPFKTLADDHYKFQVGPSESLVESLNGKIKAIEDGGIDKNEEAQLKMLKAALPEAEKNLTTARKEFANMIGIPNISDTNLKLAKDQFIAMMSPDGEKYSKQNFNTLAAGVYQQRNFLQLGEAFKSDDISRKLTANAAGIAQFNAAERERMAYLNSYLRKDELKYKSELDYAQAKAEGKIATSILINPNVTDEDTGQNYSENDFKVQVEDPSYDNYTRAFSTLKEYIATKDPNAVKGKEVTDEFLLNYADQMSKKAEDKQDPGFKEKMAVFNAYKDEYEANVYHRKAIEEKVNSQHGAELKELGKNKITLSDGTVITGKDLLNIKRTYVNADVTDGNTQVTDYFNTYTYNGKVYSERGGNKSDTKQFQSFFKQYSTIQEGIQTDRNKEYAKRYYEAKGYRTPTILIKKDDNFDRVIQSISGLNGLDEQGGYKYFGSTRSGKDMIIIPLGPKGADNAGMEIRNKSYLNKLAKNIYSGDGTAEVVQIGAGRYGIRIVPHGDILPDLPDAPNPVQLQDISRVRDYMTFMEGMLKGKGDYASALDLKNSDGTYFTHRDITIKTPYGNKIKIRAEYANGQVSLIPSYEKEKGKWQEYSRSFSSPEELILKYADLYNPRQQ